MNRKEARALLGNRAKWELTGMARALQVHAWRNSDLEWERLRALRALGYKIAVSLPEMGELCAAEYVKRHGRDLANGRAGARREALRERDA